MKIDGKRSLDRKGYGATVGTFDGLHRGHDMVIRTLVEESEKRGLLPLVLTLDRHPLETVAPERAPRLIISHEEKTAVLRRRKIGVETVEFTPETASLTARQWLEILRDSYGVGLLVVGHDNTFGCDGRGMSPADYAEAARELGIEVVVAPVEDGISSSTIRRLLAEGDVEEASRMLGRRYGIRGEVVAGNALGRKIGFPTANVKPGFKALLPKDGVYSAEAILPDGSRRLAVVNIGTRPTVTDSGHRTIEAHIPGFQGELYGEILQLDFLRRLRGERKFDSIDSLVDRIRRDIAEATEDKFNLTIKN